MEEYQIITIKRGGQEHRYTLSQRNFPFSLEGIETDINKRWEEGIDHHPKSVEIVRAVSELDFCFLGDYFCWKYGGDGDNGEMLAYLLDIYFEAKDKAGEK